MDASEKDHSQNETAGAIESKDLRNGSLSQASQNSQTASDFIDSQLQLEADAREALPFKFELCTQPLGPLRQNLYSCLTCSPPPDSPSAPYTPAAVCYSCSIACHGEHTLVELFNRRNFVCDCGTTRLPATSPCTLRIDPATGMKAPVHSQAPAEGNTYNQNCRNRFCGCGEIYNAEEEKGTMFQCLGLAHEADGGCGEDWWHPECVVGLGRGWARAKAQEKEKEKEEAKDSANENEEAETEHPLAPGFPEEESFETFICYKCVEANPWIERYAGSTGFLPPVYNSQEGIPERITNDSEKDATTRFAQYKAAQAEAEATSTLIEEPAKTETNCTTTDPPDHTLATDTSSNNKKRTASEASLTSQPTKKPKPSPPYHSYLPPAPIATTPLSLFCRDSFRDHLCRCPECYPLLKPHPQLLEEEESYEPPISESGDEENRLSVGTGSLLDRGEAALSNVDRVRAIEGVMVYNHLKSKVKSFLAPFAESGTTVGAEDVKAYFEKLRGDEQGIREAAASGAEGGGEGGGSGDQRREQSGY